MTSIQKILLDLQEETRQAVKLADESAIFATTRGGSISRLLVLVNTQVEQLEAMTAKAKRAQDRLVKIGIIPPSCF